jgi:hypothetical protein
MYNWTKEPAGEAAPRKVWRIFFCGSDTTDCFARRACHDLAKNKAMLRSIAKHGVMVTSPMGQ